MKNGSAVRNAFREVVAEPSLSTVAVFAGSKQVALGTIVGSDGYILTKSSEVKDKSRIYCKLKDGRRKRARLVGLAPEFDLAMLKIDAEGLVPVVWNRDHTNYVGQLLATPGLHDVPIAVGVLSVKPRKIPPQRGILGVSIDDAMSGAKIIRVYENTGADKAGLKAGDIITRVAGEIVSDHSALISIIRRFRPGDTLRLLIKRDDSEITVHATLTPPLPALGNRNVIQNRMGGKLSSRRAGFPSVFQHDTVLKPEDCGGPVVDLNGTVVGINIARSGRTETFAIPVASILPLLDDLKSGKLAPPAAKSIIAGSAEPPPLPEGS
ncbi:MAG: PDZ domain-containing protein [Planctomycetes bacterium]|nr:PDZ domain-containing protein [Planctomycetota bacterium]